MSRLKGQMEERETGNCTQMDPHKRMHPFTWRIHTFLVGSVLFISFPPLQHTLHKPQPIKLPHLFSELEVCHKKKEGGRDRMHGRDRGGQARV